MKRNISKVIWSLSIGACCLGAVQAEEKAEEKVPKIVEEVFAEFYPDVEVKEWELDKHGYWEAKFEIGDLKFRADFFKEGKWRETERDIKFLELPFLIRKSIQEKFSDRELNEIEWVDSAEKGLFYDLEFKKEGPNMDVVYAPDGTIIDIENQQN